MYRLFCPMKMTMMKTILLNGSPRKNWNTALMLKEARRGAEAAGAETEYVDLFDLSYTGCRSCLACKRKGGERCKCFWKDDLSPLLRHPPGDGLQPLQHGGLQRGPQEGDAGEAVPPGPGGGLPPGRPAERRAVKASDNGNPHKRTKTESAAAGSVFARL